MSLIVGVLSLGDGSLRAGYMAARPSWVPPAESGPADALLDVASAPSDQGWTSIVIDHLGYPAGDLEFIDRLHQAAGVAGGVGYHFVVGNGRGLDAGVVSITERWIEQRPGALPGGRESVLEAAGERPILICLVGNGNRRDFGEPQLEGLVNLVRRLQTELGIPADRVHRRRVLDPTVDGPGSRFPTARVRQLLRP